MPLLGNSLESKEEWEIESARKAISVKINVRIVERGIDPCDAKHKLAFADLKIC